MISSSLISTLSLDYVLSFRQQVSAADVGRVRAIVASTGCFTQAEIEMAVYLVEEQLAKGRASGYSFVFAEADGRTCGYACYGPIPCTVASYDLYWIAVEKEYHGLHVGQALANEVERLIWYEGGRRIYADTSSRPEYESAHSFYERNGYQREADLKDFYSPGDDKVIYVKALLEPELSASLDDSPGAAYWRCA